MGRSVNGVPEVGFDYKLAWAVCLTTSVLLLNVAHSPAAWGFSHAGNARQQPPEDDLHGALSVVPRSLPVFPPAACFTATPERRIPSTQQTPDSLSSLLIHAILAEVFLFDALQGYARNRDSYG